MSWKKKDIDFLKQNIGVLSFEQMAAFVDHSEVAIRQYCHRYRIQVKEETVGRNLVKELLTMKFVHPENFMPNRRFFDTVCINQKRWWNLYFGREKMTEKEYERLVRYFGVTLQEAFDARQLTLFEND